MNSGGIRITNEFRKTKLLEPLNVKRASVVLETPYGKGEDFQYVNLLPIKKTIDLMKYGKESQKPKKNF